MVINVKYLLLILSLFINFCLYAQTGRLGINTTNPLATLDVQPKNISGTTNEGIIAPKLSKQRVASIAFPEEGTMVYVDDVSYAGSSSVADNRVSDITVKGYYFYNGTKWVGTSALLGGGSSYTGSSSIFLSGNSFQRAALTGDVTAGLNDNVTTVEKLRGYPISNTAPSTGQVLKWESGQWTPSDETINSSNIYTTDGTLSSNRTLNMAGRNLIFSGNGNLGLGIFNPIYKIDMNGTLKVSDDNGDARILINANEGRYGVLRYYRSDISRWDVGVNVTPESGDNSGSDFYIGSWTDNGQWKEFAILINRSTGNVGIGTISPSQKLEVNGFVRAKGFYGSNPNTIFPDYVFEDYYLGESVLKPQYKFKKLDEVEEYIRDYGRLPSYPSTEEVKKQGYVDLSQVQLTNVEKIEELFLHTIQQEKEIEALKKKIEFYESSLKIMKERFESIEEKLQQIENNK